MKSEITIIMLLYKTPAKLLRRLSILRNFKIIILDQSDDYKTKNFLIKKFSNIIDYNIRAENLGFAKGVNDLVKKVKTKYFLCIQPDISINSKSIFKLKKTLDKKKDGIISVPKISGFRDFSKIKDGKFIVVNRMIGAVFLANKKRFIEIGNFDTDFFFYWEDIELSNRISASKYKIILNPEAKAKHYSSSSSKSDLNTDFIRHSNFMYGELLYDYKIKKIRLIKIFRKFFNSIFLSIFFILTFQIKNLWIHFAKIYGISKYINIFLKEKFFKFMERWPRG